MSLLITFLRHPRKLWLRRALFQIHLWLGVLLALYLVVISVTGSILVFKSELSRVQMPGKISRYDATRTAPIGTVLDRFAVAYPGSRIDDLTMPSPLSPAFILAATDAHGDPFTLWADPTTGDALPQQHTWLDLIYDLHVYLLLGKTHGMQVNGIGAAGLLLLAGSGLFLWWPGIKIWTRGVRIGFGHSWRRINFDTHNAIGFWTLSIVVWWALSGVYFAWYRQVAAAVASVSPLHGMLTPTAPVLSHVSTAHGSLAQLLQAIQRTSPGGKLFSLSDPSLRGSIVYALVDLRAPGDFSHRDIITLSTADCRVLTVWHYGKNQSLGDWFLWAMHPLHFGTLWGLYFKIVWSLLGLSLAILTVTGLLMYWNRYLRHKIPK